MFTSTSPSEPQTVLPFYQRKGFVSAMIAVTLLAVGVAVLAVVLLSNNIDVNTGGVTTSSDDSLLPVSGQGGPAPQTSPSSKDPVTGQTAPVPTSTVPSRPTSTVPSSNAMKTSTSSPTSNPSNIPTNLRTMPSVLTYLAPLLEPEDGFGESVAIYEDTIVVGAHKGDARYGSAHVFVGNGEEWTYQAKLLVPDGAANDFLGECVAIFEDTIVVGAQYGDDSGFHSGVAHVFVRSGETWTHEAALAPVGGGSEDYFGCSVALYGDTIVAGVPWDDDNGIASGSVHVFARSGEEWNHQAKLLAPDGAAYHSFGGSIAIYGDTIVVGAWRDDNNGDYMGQPHLFIRGGEIWTHQAKLLAPDGAEGDKFGASVAIFDDRIVVGAFGDDDNGDDSGSAYVFVRSGEEWTHQAKLLTAHQAKLLAPDGAAYDWFGRSTALYKDTIVVGASGDGNNNGSGVLICLLG
ncbi:hypothetical protein THAOC_01254 [Thalassiosira oceanica]|uniref:Uncharacterized protein n=1 Tax=Thalassiosira oceanica TaxID=159749 RepID=K0THL0_THAOC|nr:hypothetical protein THAOC_01254 [Thalassiosira oceanica]|eukprot:EJK76955.1 hypothetical protein THAOC_01254 [Thalassiosira oceanica]